MVLEIFPRSPGLHKIWVLGTSLAVQWLRLCASTTGGTGLIPGQGTKIPRAAQCSQKKKDLSVRRTLEENLSSFQAHPGLPLDFWGGGHLASSWFHPGVDAHCLTMVQRPWNERREALSGSAPHLWDEEVDGYRVRGLEGSGGLCSWE